jgi:hypothetical protein
VREREHCRLRNRLSPEATEKLVYVHPNSKLAAAVRDADELTMLARDNEEVQPVPLARRSSGVVPGLARARARPGQIDTL